MFYTGFSFFEARRIDNGIFAASSMVFTVTAKKELLLCY